MQRRIIYIIGEGGIRTLGPFRDTAFRERHNRPTLTPLHGFKLKLITSPNLSFRQRADAVQRRGMGIL